MLWTPHIIMGLIISFLLYPFYGIEVLIILVSNILIDADHYLQYILWMKDNNLFKAFRFYKNRKLRLRYKNLLHIFHTSEFLIILIILSFYYKFFLLVLIGVVTHLILDIVDVVNRNVVDIRVWSFLEFFIIKIKRFL